MEIKKEFFKSFENVWSGGYYEGDPLDPVGPSKYRRIGYISVLHAVYLMCIKPYVGAGSVSLEIGPGRGAWTKTLLDSKEVWCIDAKSREDNEIDEYLGYPETLNYFQVDNFLCKELPDNYFTYMFSFGCLCHVPWQGVCDYAANIYPKLKSGANCFWMIADYDKRNYVSDHFEDFDIYKRTVKSPWLSLLKMVNSAMSGRLLGPGPDPVLDKDNDLQTGAGRWYHSGKARTAKMLADIGYEVISPDVSIVARDVIIHFRKP